MNDITTPDIFMGNNQAPSFTNEKPISKGSVRYSFPSQDTEGGKVFLAVGLKTKEGITEKSVQTVVRKIGELKQDEYLQTATDWRGDNRLGQSRQQEDFAPAGAVATALENLPTSRSRMMIDTQKEDGNGKEYPYNSNVKFINTGIKRNGVVLAITRCVEHTMANDSRVSNPVQRSVVDFEWVSEMYANDVLSGLRSIEPHRVIVEPKP